MKPYGLTFLVLCVSACSTPTEIVLVVSSDLAPSQLGSVQVAVATTPDGDLGQSTCVCVGAGCPSARVSVPITLSLRPGRQGEAPFRVVVDAFADLACTMTPDVEARAQVRFVSGERRELYLPLETICVDKMCPADETCDPTSGACVSDQVTLTPFGSQDLSAPRDGFATTDMPPADLSPIPSFDVATNVDVGSFATTTDGTSFYVAYSDIGGTSLNTLTSTTVDSVTGVLSAGHATNFNSERIGSVCAAAAKTAVVYGALATTIALGKTSLHILDDSFTENPTPTPITGSPTALQCAVYNGQFVFAWGGVDTLTLGAAGMPVQQALTTVVASSSAPLFSLANVAPAAVSIASLVFSDGTTEAYAQFDPTMLANGIGTVSTIVTSTAFAQAGNTNEFVLANLNATDVTVDVVPSAGGSPPALAFPNPNEVAIAPVPGGNFIVAATSADNVLSVQRVDGNGNPLDANALTLSAFAQSPTLTVNSAGVVLVTWLYCPPGVPSLRAQLIQP